MTPTKLLIGQIIVVFAIILAGVWFATQWAAAQLAYQPGLGELWLLVAGVARCWDARLDVVKFWLALRCLSPHCKERWPLELYRDAAA